MRKKPWRIWIDTGGTFTDCIAVDPEGQHQICKVLSSGALRDRIESIDKDGRLFLRGATDLPDGFLTGFRLSALGEDSEIEIVDHDRESGSIALAPNDSSFFQPGSPVELRSEEEAPLLATRLMTGKLLDDDLPPLAMRLATTRGTNALLERRGARVVHFSTAGFEDLLRIGDQRRPDLFALSIERPEPLPEEVVGVPERLAADGSVIKSLERGSVDATIADLRRRGFTVASIALLHGHRNPIHERLLETALIDAGFECVARSSALSPFQGLLRRTQTSVTDAYLGPVIAEYLRTVRIGLGGEDTSLHVMTSAGGLVDTIDYRPMDSLLSGPAGGVVGAAMAGQRAGIREVIAFDMGGTSTDVARFDGDFEYVFEHRVGPVQLAVPALAIETVAAGGGSICDVRQGRLAVGPHSAGADPGPASYGAGGPLSLTDVNLLLGRLVPSRFPIPIDVEAARKQFETLRRELGADDSGTDEEILEGLLRIADERMAEAIRHISVRKGMDPADYSLVAFGGAGGQHACRVAELLGMEQIMLPGDAGLLSAMGLGHAVIERFAQREVLLPLDGVEDRLQMWLRELETEAERALEKEGIARPMMDRPRQMIELRYLGQDAVLEIEPPEHGDLGSEFERRYFELFSHRPSQRGIEVVSLRVVLRSIREEISHPMTASSRDGPVAGQSGSQRCHMDGRWREVPCFEAQDLESSATVQGPALIQQLHSALVVGSSWTAQSLGDGGVLLQTRKTPETGNGPFLRRQRPRAVELELMSHRFSSIAGEMGEMLRRTAVSTNIKEREDFSCTLLDSEGRLVVNAPHQPVHLGAMGLCVRALASHRPMAPGDVVMTNHPAFGGSHLPDLTLVAPVHHRDRLLGYVACRAHHAEIGGIRPGSVPPNARSLAEEGVVLPPTLLVKGYLPAWQGVEKLLTGGEFPSRMPADNLADLRAMLAAITRGSRALVDLSDAVGCDHVTTHMDALRHQAAGQIRLALRRLPDGEYSGRQLLDDGSALVATFRIRGDHATLDFTGSAPVHPGNLNATPAIVHSVTIYVMRLLVDMELPLNEGLLDPVEIRIPEGLLNPPYVEDPYRCPAVVGGNVETSQRLVDTLLQALRLAGCSQGTMNNLSFGDHSFGYYETVAGGSGATDGHNGESGVHTHMTNTRITDPEILEHRYPVRLRRFEIKRGSGGSGRWRGGDGLVREIEFLAPLELSILSQHRASPPYGMDGGGDGSLGHQVVIGADGSRRTLSGIDGCDVGPGDRFVLETPGGGGFGEPES